MKRRKFIGSSAAFMGLALIDNTAQAKEVNENKPNSLVKTFYQHHQQYDQVCYCPVLSQHSEDQGMVFIRYKDGQEDLIFQDQKAEHIQTITSGQYLSSPALSGEDVYWIQGDKKNWAIWHYSLRDMDSPSSMIDHWGRPNSLSLSKGSEKPILVWEERQGKQTRIYLGLMSGGSVINSIMVSDGIHNGYDPMAAIDQNGFINIVYSSFFGGNYRIMHSIYGQDGKLFQEPKCISDSASPCLKPSVWPRAKGGIWCSYTDMMVDPDFVGWDIPYVQHPRREKQHDFFRSKGIIMVRALVDGEILAPYASPNSIRQGFTSHGILFGSVFSKISQVFEDAQGRLGVVFRKHQKVDMQEIGSGEMVINSHKYIQNEVNTRSGILVSYLNDDTWTTPSTIVKFGHYELPLSLKVSKESTRLAYVVDGRFTGWGKNGECFDRESEIGLGVLALPKNTAKENEYEMSKIYIKPSQFGGMEEPKVSDRNGERIVFGQTHLHTTDSVCNRAYDQGHHANFRFMQDVQQCDFAGISDHSYNQGPLERHKMRKIADYYYFPDEFVALQAYEWTSKEGHVNPLCFEEDEDLEVYNPNDSGAPGSSFVSMWEHYKGKKIIAPPHHVVDYDLPFEWENYIDNLMPVVEIFQDRRGSGEQAECPGATNYSKKENGYWIADEVRGNKKFGFIAGGDHSGLALAGLKVKELTRTALYEAFLSKSCFATTGQHIDLSFHFEGSVMGSIIGQSKGRFKLSVDSPELIDYVEIVHDAKVHTSHAVTADRFDHSWEGKKGVWYCRIINQSGDVSWTSPIWLEA